MSTVLETDTGRLSGTPAEGRARRFGLWLLSYRGVHYAILVIAALFLLYESRHQGLFYDDWSFVVPSAPSIWSPHEGHWSTVPMLIYFGIRGTFGLDHFLPFAIPGIAAQLGLATLVWRIMLHARVAPWIATAASALVCFLGAGGENILWAFQMGFMGAIALSLIVMLLLMRTTFGAAEAVGVIVLSILALATSGTSLPVLLGAGIVGIVFRGFRRTLLLFVLPVAAYGSWFVLVYMRSPGNSYRASSVYQFVTQAPQYILNLLAGGTGEVVGIAALGAALFGVVVAWSVFRLPNAPKEWTASYACLLAAILFAALTAYTRLNLGNSVSSRYVFMVTVLFLPMAMIALSTLARRLRLPAVGFAAVVGIVVAYNFTTLLPVLAQRSAEVAQTQQELAAAAKIIKQGKSYPADGQPAYTWAPPVSMSDLKEMLDRGWIHPGESNVTADLTVDSSLYVHIRPADAPSDNKGCSRLQGETLGIDVGTHSLIQAPGPTQIQYTVTRGTTGGIPITVTLSEGWNDVTSATGNVRLVGTAQPLVVCRR